MLKSLLMMRIRGINGPKFAKHMGVKGLSKSVGNFIGGSDGNLIRDPGFDTPDDGDPWVTTGGWTIANGVAHNDGTIGNLTQTI